MGSIKDLAGAYEPSVAKNISELSKIPVGVEVYEFEGTTVGEDGNEVPFRYKYITVGDERYRLPVSVLKQLKAHLEENPSLVAFKVRKSGEGLKTEYTVIPLGNGAGASGV